MSRFFQNDVSGSESEYDSSSEEDEISIQPEQGVSRRRKWEIGNGDSDSESDTDRKTLKSKKDKQLEDLRKLSESMLEMMEFDDWIKVSDDFDKLLRLLENYKDELPRFYVRSIAKMEDELLEADKDKEFNKQMNSSTAKAYNAVKQKIKREAVKREEKLAGFRENWVDEDQSEDERNQQDQDLKTVRFMEVVKEKKLTVFEQLDKILENRGKRNTDKNNQVILLEQLREAGGSKFQRMVVLNALIPARFDATIRTSEMWQSSLEDIINLYDLLEDLKNVHLGTEEDDSTYNKKEDLALTGSIVKVKGSPATYVDRLDDEYFKSLQNMDENSSEYLERQSKETEMYSLVVRAFSYSSAQQSSQEILDSLCMRRLEHTYYLRTSLVNRLESDMISKYPELKELCAPSGLLVQSLCKTLFTSSVERFRARSLLCLIFNLSENDEFQEAKNLMLQCNLQDYITQADIPTQALYNRTLVVVGLSAFRAGKFHDSHSCLLEICSSGKMKELLAQGVSQNKYSSERTADQEKLDRSRQLPYHMHLDLDLIEGVFLVSAMLLEIPNIVSSNYDLKKKIISKTFRKMMEQSDRQLFQGSNLFILGPPENTRDFVMGAAKAIIKGEWSLALENVFQIEIWAKMNKQDTIKATLTE